MRSALVALILLLSFQSVQGEVSKGLARVLKQADPNKLAYLARVGDDCPLSSDEVEKVVEGVLISSGITPWNSVAWLAEEIYLSVKLTCVKAHDSNPAYVIQMEFGKANGDSMILYDYDFGAAGIGPAETIKQALKYNVERAIADYIEVNFDLGD